MSSFLILTLDYLDISNGKILSYRYHVCAYGNVTGQPEGTVCHGDSGGPLIAQENGRSEFVIFVRYLKIVLNF